MVGLERLELSTPRLSSVCSNQLSYKPPEKLKKEKAFQKRLITWFLELFRKEEIRRQQRNFYLGQVRETYQTHP